MGALIARNTQLLLQFVSKTLAMEQVCRTCMINSVALVDIFTDQRQPSLAAMLNECVACEIKLGDELPKKICLSCICDVQTAFAFKRRCEKSHLVLTEKLKKIVLGSAIKVESTEAEMDPTRVKLEPDEFGGTGNEVDKSAPKGECNTETSRVPDVEAASPNQSPSNVQSELLETENWELAERDIDLGCVKVEANETMHTEEIVEQLPTEPGPQTHEVSHVPAVDEQLSKKSQFLCPHCPKTFTQKSHLSAHIRTHTGERPFQCTHCPKAFSQASNLRKHMCIHSGERPFKCPHCTRAFTRHTDLQYHISTHPGKQIHKCPHCTRYFIEEAELEEHLRYHKGERTYKCTECAKEYTYAWQLQRHLRTHTGEHPFKCPHCLKNCIDKGDLGRHIRSHTGERPHKCPHCPKAFTRAAYLKTHVKTHHSQNSQ